MAPRSKEKIETAFSSLQLERSIQEELIRETMEQANNLYPYPVSTIPYGGSIDSNDVARIIIRLSENLKNFESRLRQEGATLVILAKGGAFNAYAAGAILNLYDQDGALAGVSPTIFDLSTELFTLLAKNGEKSGRRFGASSKIELILTRLVFQKSPRLQAYVPSSAKIDRRLEGKMAAADLLRRRGFSDFAIDQCRQDPVGTIEAIKQLII